MPMTIITFFLLLFVVVVVVSTSDYRPGLLQSKLLPKKGLLKFYEDGYSYYPGSFVEAIPDSDSEVAFCSTCRDCCCGIEDPWTKKCDECSICYNNYVISCNTKCPDNKASSTNNGSWSQTLNLSLVCPPVTCDTTIANQTHSVICSPTVGQNNSQQDSQENSQENNVNCTFVNKQWIDCRSQQANQTCQNECLQGGLSCMADCMLSCTGTPVEIQVCINISLANCEQTMGDCYGNNCGFSFGGFNSTLATKISTSIKNISSRVQL